MPVDVLHLISGLSTGGAERTLANLLCSGLAQGQTHWVVSLGGVGPVGEELRRAGIRVECLDAASPWSALGVLRRLRRCVRRASPRVVQGWMYHGNLAATVAGKLAGGRPSVCWNIRHSLHDIRKEQPATRMVIRAHRLFGRGASAVVYNSDVARVQHERFGIHVHRTYVIPNGVDVSRFSPSAEHRGEVRRQLGIPEGALVVGQVGRNHPMKNHEGLLRALAPQMRRDQRLYVVLVGRGVAHDPQLAACCKDERIGSRVRLHDERADVEAVMAAFDVYCSSSVWGEAFPNVVAEALACGVPCVATDVGDSARVVEGAGLVVPAGDGAALARALDTLLSMPSEERTRLGVQGRQRMIERFGMDRAVARYRDLYQMLCAR